MEIKIPIKDLLLGHNTVLGVGHGKATLHVGAILRNILPSLTENELFDLVEVTKIEDLEPGDPNKLIRFNNPDPAVWKKIGDLFSKK